MGKSCIITFHIPAEWKQELEKLIEKYGSVSSVVREAIANLIKKGYSETDGYADFLLRADVRAVIWAIAKKASSSKGQIVSVSSREVAEALCLRDDRKIRYRVAMILRRLTDEKHKWKYIFPRTVANYVDICDEKCLENAKRRLCVR